MASLNWKTLKPRTRLQVYIALGISLFLMIVVPLVGWFNTLVSDTRFNDYVASNAQNAVDNNFIIVGINITEVTASKMSSRITLFPSGSFSLTPNDPYMRLQSDINITLDNTVQKVLGGSPFPSFTYDFPVIEGNPNRYPLDRYTAQSFIGANQGG